MLPEVLLLLYSCLEKVFQNILRWRFKIRFMISMRISSHLEGSRRDKQLLFLFSFFCSEFEWLEAQFQICKKVHHLFRLLETF